VTVVSGLNPARLNQLESQCRRWRGPISASVYVALRVDKKGEAAPEKEQEKLRDAAEKVEKLHAK
jgi:hypothetical protein